MRRSNVEMRSRDLVAPRQNVADIDDNKPTAPSKPVVEKSAMSLALARRFNRD